MKDTEIEKNLKELQKQILKCKICEEKFGFEPRPVVTGNYNSKIVQIGQAPSKKVHETGKPFNDASGKKLKHEWYGISDEEFYNPDNFYIASAALCFPGKANGGGDSQPPRICSKLWLFRQMDLVQNEIYILIGGYAAKIFFPNETLTSLVFEDKEIRGKPAFVLPHPSPLNIKWFKDNPAFYEERIGKIKKEIRKALGY